MKIQKGRIDNHGNQKGSKESTGKESRQEGTSKEGSQEGTGEESSQEGCCKEEVTTAVQPRQHFGGRYKASPEVFLEMLESQYQELQSNRN
jgi:hypothetical protein